MQRQNIIRVFLFIIFFGIGVASLGGSILWGDLIQHYRNKQLLKATQELLEQLRSLNADYDALLAYLEGDPNFVKRIAPITLGTESEDPDAVYPSATPEQLAVAREALIEETSQQDDDSMVPAWLVRFSQPRRRIMFFFTGAGLILISFACFAPKTKGPQEQG